MKGCDYMNLNGGYAMIKYNSTQEELQIAYRSKRPALFYDENQRAHWAVIEETATESVDEETQEPITTYKYSYRLLDEDSGGGSNLLEDIVDKNGNKRFIDGNVPVNSLGQNIECLYNKWSLSGTHLMIVIVLVNNSSSVVSLANELIFTLQLQDWIMGKIVPDSNNLISTIVTYDLARTGSVFFDFKKISNELKLYGHNTSVDLKANSTYRIQIDLLIDNE